MTHGRLLGITGTDGRMNVSSTYLSQYEHCLLFAF